TLYFSSQEHEQESGLLLAECELSIKRNPKEQQQQRRKTLIERPLHQHHPKGEEERMEMVSPSNSSLLLLSREEEERLDKRWYFGNISKRQAEKILSSYHDVFLCRKNEKKGKNIDYWLVFH